MPTIDLTEVKGLTPMDPGTYVATIVSAKEGIAASSGFPKMDLRWKIEGGKYDGRQIFDVMSFKPEALWRVKSTLMALGFPKDFSGELTPEDLIGKTATVVVTISQESEVDPETGDPYPPRNRISKVKSVAAAGKSAADLLS